MIPIPHASKFNKPQISQNIAHDFEVNLINTIENSATAYMEVIIPEELNLGDIGELLVRLKDAGYKIGVRSQQSSSNYSEVVFPPQTITCTHSYLTIQPAD